MVLINPCLVLMHTHHMAYVNMYSGGQMGKIVAGQTKECVVGGGLRPSLFLARLMPVICGRARLRARTI